MRATSRLAPNPALAEILADTGELDEILDGRGLRFDQPIELGPPAALPQRLYIPAGTGERKPLICSEVRNQAGPSARH